jgi:hypothetical protein
MKKLIVVLGVVAIGFCFASCKKEKACKCTTKFALTEEALGQIPAEVLPLVPATIKSGIEGTYDAGEKLEKDCEDFKAPIPDDIKELATQAAAFGITITEADLGKYFMSTCKSE